LSGAFRAWSQTRLFFCARAIATARRVPLETANKAGAGWQPTLAIRKMKEWTGGHLDDTLYKAFVKTVGIYPVGSLVRLQSQRLAVIIDHDPAHLLQPTARVFFSPRSNMHIPPTDVDLGSKSAADRIVGIEDPATHGLSRFDKIWTMASTDA
jgi:hypothetical protein